MSFTVKAKQGRVHETKTVEGVRSLHNLLATYSAKGWVIKDISRVKNSATIA